MSATHVFLSSMCVTGDFELWPLVSFSPKLFIITSVLCPEFLVGFT